jgi:hypothetical protein
MRWERLPQSGDVPGPRSSQCLVPLGGSLYLFGGELQPRVPVANDLFRYDPSSGAWARVDAAGEAPCPRIAATAAAVGNDIYVFGGRYGRAGGGAGQVVLGRCWRRGGRAGRRPGRSTTPRRRRRRAPRPAGRASRWAPAR